MNQMKDLNESLEHISNTCSLLNSLSFRPSGIFTNALIHKPEITKLLRDADKHENALYYIGPSFRAERKDGTHGILDRIYDELESFKSNFTETKDHDQRTSMPVILVPESEESKDSNSEQKIETKATIWMSEDDKEQDIESLFEIASKLLDKYPAEGVGAKLENNLHQYRMLKQEILEYEQLIEKQKRQLSLISITLNDSDPFDKLTEHSISNKGISQLISEEEEEIKQLEEKISLQESLE